MPLFYHQGILLSHQKYGIRFLERLTLKHSKEAKNIWIRKTYSYRVTPRKSDIALLNSVNATLINLWNSALDHCMVCCEHNQAINHTRDQLEVYTLPSHKEMYFGRTAFITPISLNFWLTGIRKNNHHVEEVSVVLEREMLRRLAGSFSSYFTLRKKGDTRARLPRAKDTEKSFIALTWTTKSFSIDQGMLTASVGSRRTVVFALGQYINKILKELPAESTVAQVTVSKRGDEYWANFVCNIPRPADAPMRGIIAIDLGSGDIACCTSDGKEFSFAARRPDKWWRKKIYTVENRLEKCQKGSRAWKRRSKARKVMHRKSLHQHTDHQRKLADWIVKQGLAVVVGKMNTRLGLAKSDGTADQHWGVQNTGYAFRLLVFLKEKASEHGITLLEFPDPPRNDLENPDQKFESARTLLRKGCAQLNIFFPQKFDRISFSFTQG